MLADLLLALALTVPLQIPPQDRITPKLLPIPERTAWKPVGCRNVPFTHPALLPRTAFRRAHGDLDSSDEVALAYAPVFAREWAVEPNLYQATTPAFDSAGNLYMTPLLPHEPILLLSLEPNTGARRFVIPLEPGQRGGGAVPLVLRDPDTGGDVIYVNGYSHIIAVRADGTQLWKVATGLGSATTAAQSPIGLAWVPNADAIVSLMRDGFVLLHDRETGDALTAPLQLPGERTPPVPSNIPAPIAATVTTLLQPFITFSSPGGVVDFINVLLGGDSEVANNFSVDGRNNRLWIAASAPDGEDGTIDGVSELGAVYRYDVVRTADGSDGCQIPTLRWRLIEVCHRSFSGGSASTPTLGQDGTRVYLGDNVGALIAINADDCSDAWEVPLDSQIFGSVTAASDGREIYAASAAGVFQVIDEGTGGRRGWTAMLDLYDVPPDLASMSGINLLLTGAGANGLLIHAGVGARTPEGQSLPVRTGIAHIDRLTGAPRWFADDLEESLGAMSTGPDGALYLPHAPLRRAFTFALGQTTAPLVGGVSKWSSTRDDLLARDAACAAAERATNAVNYATECPASARADLDQVEALRLQLIDATGDAVAHGHLAPSLAAQVEQLAEGVSAPPARPSEEATLDYLDQAATDLGRACDLLVSATQ